MCVLPMGTGLALVSPQVQWPESSTPHAPHVAFKHPFKPAVLNTHCENKTKPHLVVRWVLSSERTFTLGFVTLYWLSRQSSDFTVIAAGHAIALSVCAGWEGMLHSSWTTQPLPGSVDSCISKNVVGVVDVLGNCFLEWNEVRGRNSRCAEDKDGKSQNALKGIVDLKPGKRG